MVDKNKIKPGKQNIGNSGEYYLAYLLSANGFITTITLGRAEKYDIVAINPEGNTIKLQVKTLYGKGVQWRMNPKDGVDRKDSNFFYAFVRLNELQKQPDFWIVPSSVVAEYVSKNYNKWFNSLGKNGQKHNETLARAFRVKYDKYTPENWTEECKKYEKSLELLK